MFELTSINILKSNITCPDDAKSYLDGITAMHIMHLFHLADVVSQKVFMWEGTNFLDLPTLIDEALFFEARSLP